MTGTGWHLLGALAAGGAGYIATHYMHPHITVMLRRGGMVRANYAGEPVPVGMGVTVPLALLPVFIVFAPEPTGIVRLWLTVMFATALVGFVDDAVGDRTASGLKGHFQALARKQWTTGFLKAVTGVLVAWHAAKTWHGNGALFVPDGNLLARTALGTVVMALAMNSINLLDVRPGRAMKGFTLLMGLAWIGLLTPLTVGARMIFPATLFPLAVVTTGIAGAVAALAPVDFGSRGMLGDTGANVLGAAAGLVAVAVPPYWQTVMVVGLLLLHALTERRSLSDIIDGSGFLTRLDRWGRTESRKTPAPDEG